MRPSVHRPRRVVSPAIVIACVLTAAGVATAAGVMPGASSAKRRGQASLHISGSLSRKLAPGVSAPLKLRLTNRRGFALRVSRLRISASVDRRHARAGCRVSRDLSIRQLRTRLPVRVLPAHRTRSLSQLGVRALPRVAMRNSNRNQDACRGARFRLAYKGKAVKARRSKR